MKKYNAVFGLCALCAASIWAKSGLEYTLNIPFGLGVGIYKAEVPDTVTTQFPTYKSAAGMDGGLTGTIGYFWQFNDSMGLSILGEIGYSRDSIGLYNEAGSTDTSKVYSYYDFDSLLIGLWPKFNWNQFYFGLGFGVKVPLGGTQVSRTDVTYPINGNRTSNIRYSPLSYNDLKNTFVSTVIPYLKFTFDYMIFNIKNVSLNAGAYIGGDFPIVRNDPSIADVKHNYSSFDMGISISVKYGASLKS